MKERGPTRAVDAFERRLAILRGHPIARRPVELYFRRRQPVLYLVVGLWNTLFAYAVWAGMQSMLGGYFSYVVVLCLAWPIVVLNAYLGYRLIVFRSQANPVFELPRFVLVYFAALLANILILPIALALLPFSIYVVQALFTVALVTAGYLAHKYFSFRVA